MATADNHLDLEGGTSGMEGHRFFTSLLADKTLRDLVDLLLRLEPNTRIPSERELCETLKVSRTSIRDRLSRLDALGVLQRKERSGTYFTGIHPENVSDVLVLSMLSQQMTVESLVSVRHALERQAVIEACENATEAVLDEIKHAVDWMDSTNDGYDLFLADNEFHRKLFKASQSEGLIFFSRMLHAVLQGTVQHLMLERDRLTLRSLHRNIYKAIKARDQRAAVQAMDEHFDWLDHLRESGGADSADG